MGCSNRIAFALTLAIVTSARVGSAQQATADSAWTAGDFHIARINYERVLAGDPRSVRANYRLGVLASWDGKLDSALVLIYRAREVEPRDPDLRITEARVLSWDGRYDEAIARYDSVIAEFPERTDAVIARAQTLTWASRFRTADSAYAAILALQPGNINALTGRAQLAAWRGDLPNAIVQYQSALRADPDNAEARAGLGQAYLWQGRISEAREQSVRARSSEPASRTALDLEQAIRSATRPQPELTLGWSNDSDDNTSWWQTHATSLMVADHLRVFGSLGALHASDPLRDATRISAEVGAAYGLGDLALRAALGARRLLPENGPDRTASTFSASAGYRLSSSAGVGLGFAHYPFDETALLIERDLTVNTLDASFDATLRPGLILGGGAGRAWLSDDNSRTSGVLAITQTIRRDFFAGAFLRALGYDFKGTGYFSPGFFAVAEGRGGYNWSAGPWSGRVSGGLGMQQIGSHGRVQAEWHLEGRLARRWKVDNTVEIFAGISNSAESSTTGAFRYRTAGVIVRIGL